MSNEKQKEISSYLRSGAGGSFHAEDSYGVIMAALKHSKISDVTGEEFAACLKMFGIVPDFVRAGDYRLVLPMENK
jgi:hypothetical protein